MAINGNGGAELKYGFTDPWAYVVSANLHRRHLTRDQKRELIAKLLAANPAKSDRAIGKLAQADHKTVADVRDEAESCGEIPHMAATDRVGVNGKKSRSRKPKSQPSPTQQPQPPSPPPSAEPDQGGALFATLLHSKPRDTLVDFVQTMRRKKHEITENVPLQKRVELAVRFLDAIGVTVDDLKLFGGAP